MPVLPPLWTPMPTVIRRPGNCAPLLPVVTSILLPGDRIYYIYNRFKNLKKTFCISKMKVTIVTSG